MTDLTLPENQHTLTLESTSAMNLTLAATAPGASAFDIATFATVTPAVEVGQSAQPTFTATYNRTPSSALLTDTEGGSADVVATPAAFAGAAIITKTVPNSSVTYTLTAANNGQDVAVAIVQWQPRCYFGVGPAGSSGEAFIEALAGSALQPSRAGSFAVTAGAAEKVYWAAPTAYGAPTLSVGGFAGGFFKVGDFNVTNAFGVVQQYQLWESDNVDLGSLTVVVS